MRKINILILLALSFALFASCGKEDDSPPDSPDGEKKVTFPIQLYSRLNNSQLFNTDDFAAVTGRIRTSQSYFTILHRVDAVYNSPGMRNPLVSIAEETGKIPVFIRNRYADTRVEGSGILVGQTIREMSNTPVSDGSCYFSLPLMANGSVNMNIASITFENENQLATGVVTIKEKLDDQTVLVGMAAKALENKLKAEFSEGNYRIEFIEGKNENTNQIIFVITSRKWTVGEHQETAVGTDGISCFDIEIEKL
ncbi:MAG: hypothetical protein AB2L20_23725 [Mangrovibacterium sp.]